jgi:hypothetical protein
MVNESENKNEYDEKYDSFTIFNSYKTHLVLILALVIFVFIVIFSLLGSQSFMESSKPWLFAIEIVLWIILISIIVLNIKTIKSGDIDFTQQLLNLFNYNDPEVTVSVHREHDEPTQTTQSTQSTQSHKKDDKKDDQKCNGYGKDYWFSSDSSQKTSSPSAEVFHIPKNTYNYKEAEKVCKLFDSRLATYDEIERAYQNGGSWCSYGWSADQMALFPTQKEVYNELKKIPGHEHDCGRPGINGGYIKNENREFGVNCYGKKPYITPKDKSYIKQHSFTAAFDKHNKEKEKEKQKQINNILVAPFNKNKWSEL